ncbi:MAG: hypothetical protein J1F27_02510 [Prevotellaceae bacterium]|nr:hypothetical protein [Prevotellaceae bacterium]
MKETVFTCKVSKSLDFIASLCKVFGILHAIAVAVTGVLLFLSGVSKAVDTYVYNGISLFLSSPIVFLLFYIPSVYIRGKAIIVEAASKYLQSMPQNVENQENTEPIQQA